MALWGGAIAAVGSVLAFTSMFLPWVTSKAVQDYGPLANLGLGLLGSELTAFVEVLTANAELTGLDVALRFDLLPTTTRLLVAAPVLLAVLTLAVLLVTALTSARLRVAWVALAILSGVAIIALLIGSSTIIHLGLGKNLIADSIVAMLGLAKGSGYWLAIAGMVLIVVGLGIGSADSPASSYQDEGWASTESNWDW